jgi:hypothetical protein
MTIAAVSAMTLRSLARSFAIMRIASIGAFQKYASSVESSDMCS